MANQVRNFYTWAPRKNKLLCVHNIVANGYIVFGIVQYNGHCLVEASNILILLDEIYADRI